MAILNIVLIIFDILDYFVIKRLHNSIGIFYSRLETIFQIEIPQENYDETEYLDNSSNAIVFNFFVSIFSFVLIIIRCNKSLEQGRQPYTYEDFLI